MRETIVITSIYPPTEAVKKFSRLENHHLIVVADAKTPSDWHCENARYLSITEQKKMGFKLSASLPENHYCRKMLGYLLAMANGASAIIDTDDDNTPKEDWQFPAFQGTFDLITLPGFINVYQLYTNQNIWPRGTPLNLIKKDYKLTENIVSVPSEVGIWQGLADEDPDVDAIYRLTSDTPCYFNERAPVVLKEQTISPFNTQNTKIRRELFALMYLPTFVTFRFTDILRGLVAQPIMWLHGFRLGFTQASVVQKRNPHDYYKDFLSEIPMYQHNAAIIPAVERVIRADNSVEDNLVLAYQELCRLQIVEARELSVLQDWLEDLRAIYR